MRSYNEILGVKEGASREEITSRWLSLKKEYQSIPSEDPGKREKISEINEAYRNLKDSAGSCFDFDVDEYLGPGSRNKEKSASGTKGKRTFLFSAILGLILLVSGSVYIFQRITIEIRWDPRGAQKLAAAPSIVQTPIGSPQKPEKPGKDHISEEPVPPVPQTFQGSVRQDNPLPVLPELSKTVSPKPAPSLPKGKLKLIKKEPVGASIGQSAKQVSRGTAGSLKPSRGGEIAPSQHSAVEPTTQFLSRLQSLERTQEEGPKPEYAARDLLPPSTGEKDPPKPLSPIPIQGEVVDQEKRTPGEPVSFAEPERPKSVEAKGGGEPDASLPQVPTAIASQQEVRKFLNEYVGHYNRKDIPGLIPFFSAQAIQNQKDDLGRIKSIYKNFFDQMEGIRYEVSVGTIELRPDIVQVRGSYELEGTLAKGGKRLHWRGQIQWTLAREDGKLRIVSLDYQPQKDRKNP